MTANIENVEDIFDGDDSMAPSAEDYQRWNVIHEIAFRLRYAGREHDLALNIDMVLMGLEREALGKKAEQLTAPERERIMAALEKTIEVALANPPTGLQRQQMASGLLLIAHAVQFWAMPDDERKAKARLARYLRDLLRVFRNAMHNSCLLDQASDDLSALAPWQASGAALIPDLPATLSLIEYPTQALCGFVEAFSCSPMQQQEADDGEH